MTIPTKKKADLIRELENMREGKCRSSRGESDFALVARRGGNLVVECGWEIPESYDDDYLSCSWSPFLRGRMCPWVGRTISLSTAEAAAETYTRWRDAVQARRVVTEGEAIR